MTPANDGATRAERVLPRLRGARESRASPCRSGTGRRRAESGRARRRRGRRQVNSGAVSRMIQAIDRAGGSASPSRPAGRRAGFCCPPGSLPERIEMKMTLSTPRTISRNVNVTRARMPSVVKNASMSDNGSIARYNRSMRLLAMLMGRVSGRPDSPGRKPADRRLPGRPFVSPRSERFHAGAAVRRWRALRRHRVERPLVDPQGQARNGRSAAEARRPGAALRRRHHRLENGSDRAHLAIAGGLCLRQGHLSAPPHVHLRGRRLGPDARRHEPDHERRHRLSAVHGSGDLQRAAPRSE